MVILGLAKIKATKLNLPNWIHDYWTVHFPISTATDYVQIGNWILKINKNATSYLSRGGFTVKIGYCEQ